MQPEHWAPAGGTADPQATLTAAVEVIEPMGAETFAYLRVGRFSLTVRLDPQTTVRPGQDLRLVPDLARAHAFDPATGKALR